MLNNQKGGSLSLGLEKMYPGCWTTMKGKGFLDSGCVVVVLGTVMCLFDVDDVL